MTTEPNRNSLGSISKRNPHIETLDLEAFYCEIDPTLPRFGSVTLRLHYLCVIATSYLFAYCFNRTREIAGRGE
jgi:hypothetical protein